MKMKMKNLTLLLLSGVMTLTSTTTYAASNYSLDTIEMPFSNTFESASKLASEVNEFYSDEGLKAVNQLITDIGNGEADLEGFFNEKFVNPSRKAQALLALYFEKAKLMTYIGGIENGKELNEALDIDGKTAVSAIIPVGALAVITVGTYNGIKNWNVPNQKMISAFEKAGRFLNKNDFYKDAFKVDAQREKLIAKIKSSQNSLNKQMNRVAAITSQTKILNVAISEHTALNSALVYRDVYRSANNRAKNSIGYLGDEAHKASMAGNKESAATLNEQIKQHKIDKATSNGQFLANEEKVKASQVKVAQLPAEYSDPTKIDVAKLKVKEATLIGEKALLEKQIVELKPITQELNNKLVKLEKKAKLTMKRSTAKFSRSRVWVKSNFHGARNIVSGITKSIIPLAAIQTATFAFGSLQNVFFEINSSDVDETLANLYKEIDGVNLEIRKQLSE